MKNSFCLLLLMLISAFSIAQKATPFEQAESMGISIEHLDSTYASGIHTDEKLGVFNSNKDKYIESYQQLLQDLGKFLEKNEFSWTQPTKGFNRIYFDKNGKIDYFLYNFKPGQLTKDEEKKFGDLLQLFVKNYTFPLTAPKKFAQCSPVTYMPSANSD